MAGRISLFIAIFLVAIVVTSCTTKSKQGKTWCVIKQIAPDVKMQAFVDSACKKYDCKEIRPGGSCYEPRTLANHASYVLNLDYRATGRCNSDIGTTAITDPCKIHLAHVITLEFGHTWGREEIACGAFRVK